MTIVAIDFGLTRIGFAYSEGELASPLATHTVKTMEQKLAAFDQVMADTKPGKIVIGTATGTLKPHLERFVTAIQKRFHGPIMLLDETLTTRQAHDILLANQAPKKKRAQPVDAMAAALLLQYYLDKN